LINSVAFDEWPRREIRLVRAVVPVARHLPPAVLVPLIRNGLVRGYADRERGTHSAAYYIRPFQTDEGRDALVRHLIELDAAETSALAARLGEVDRPTAIVWGEHDPYLPVSIARRLRDAIPEASLDVIPGARHFTPEESPGRIGDALVALLRR
jgi:pimeloyl-ACP methyl ester carboxylesterase